MDISNPTDEFHMQLDSAINNSFDDTTNAFIISITIGIPSSANYLMDVILIWLLANGQGSQSIFKIIQLT